jgi:hypothetical protein
MKSFEIGERVRITSGISSSWDHSGKIVRIVEPFVAEHMKDKALLEMPLYFVRLGDGRSVRLRGRDLESAVVD